MMSQGAASFTIYSGTKDTLRDARILNRDTLIDTSLLGGLGSDPDCPSDPKILTSDFRGALAGSLISFGSAPFELVKVWLSLHVIEPTTVLMTSASVVSPPCCHDGRSGVSLSTRSPPQRDYRSSGLPALSKPSGIS